MILVDTSIWIDYLRGMESALPLMTLIDSNSICTNDLILAELLPSLKVRKETELVRLLESVERYSIRIDWKELITMQSYNIKNGINKVGIPDLIIAQSAVQNDLKLYSKDKHFSLMKKHIGLKIYELNRE